MIGRLLGVRVRRSSGPDSVEWSVHWLPGSRAYRRRRLRALVERTIEVAARADHAYERWLLG